MNLSEAKRALFSVCVMFFGADKVIWAEQGNTKLKPPYITLKFRDVERTAFPIEKDGERYYECSVPADINLYSSGKEMKTVGEKTIKVYENIATSDLMDFFNFLDSDEVTDMLDNEGVSVLLNSDVRDLSELEHESGYRYRAMAEVTISYAFEANGKYGISSMKEIPNSSNGGTKDMDKGVDEVGKVEITGDFE